MTLSAIILDQWVPGDQACELIAELKNRRPAVPILMLTTSTSPLLAVEAMRAGATDYLVKPVAPDRMMQALRNTTTLEAPQDELIPLTEKMDAALDFDAMVGTAPPFRAALAKAAKAARGHGSVLIEGETGTGKEMLIRAMLAQIRVSWALVKRVPRKFGIGLALRQTMSFKIQKSASWSNEPTR